jgi:acetylornithine/N-succinyldiaminopimelate aminotransferase
MPSAGIAVNTLGHNHPRLVKALAAQVARLIHASNLYRIAKPRRPPIASPRCRAWTRCSSATPAARPTRRRSSWRACTATSRASNQPAIIVMEHAFHGRTLATLSATGNRKVQAGFEPLVSGFVRVPFDDLRGDRAGRRAQSEHRRRAVRADPGRGRHQCRARITCGPAPDLRCASGWLFMVDEVQCGIGRTGAWFAHQHAGIQPDVMTLAKGLGSGVPIGACLAAGAPPACSSRATTVPPSAAIRWPARRADHDRRHRIRGADGACAALGEPSAATCAGAGRRAGIVDSRRRPDDRHRTRPPLRRPGHAGLAAGLLINVTADKVVRLLPPLVMSDAEAPELVAAAGANP